MELKQIIIDAEKKLREKRGNLVFYDRPEQMQKYLFEFVSEYERQRENITVPYSKQKMAMIISRAYCIENKRYNNAEMAALIDSFKDYRHN